MNTIKYTARAIKNTFFGNRFENETPHLYGMILGLNMLESGNWMVGMDRAQELPAMATLLMTICAVHVHEASPAWDWAVWDSRRGGSRIICANANSNLDYK